MKWWQRLYVPPAGPDRIERLLSSCRSYYREGDLDIAVLLLREAEKELARGPLFAPRE